MGARLAQCGGGWGAASPPPSPDTREVSKNPCFHAKAAARQAKVRLPKALGARLAPTLHVSLNHARLRSSFPPTFSDLIPDDSTHVHLFFPSPLPGSTALFSPG